MASAEEQPFRQRAQAWIRQHAWWIAPTLGVLYVLVWWLVPFALYRRTGTPKINELEAITSTRTALLAGLIGVGALLTFWLNSRTHRLTEQGQLTDRYTKAIEQLGSDKLDVRLGGIYALERIAVDSERDHPTVVEVLSAFVREHSQPAQTSAAEPTITELLAALLKGRNESAGAHLPDPDRSTEDEPKASSASPKPTTDVQAALTVLGRLPEVPKVSRGDLTGANLAGANLAGANLAGANLAKVDLADGNLAKANLARADLAEADLARADLAEADLSYATLIGANLERAELGKANVTGANLTTAYLFHARLMEADMPGVDLTRADMTSASLHHANLAGARIAGTNLSGAFLFDTNLSNANLGVATKGKVSLYKMPETNLTGTWLVRTNLSGVNLVGLDLSQTVHLTQEQLSFAHGDDNVPLPEEVRRPDSWKGKRASPGASS